MSVHSLLNDHLMKMAINLQLYGVFRKVKFFAPSNEKSGNKNKLTGNTSDNNNFKHQRFWKWRPFVLETSSGGGAPSEHWCKMRTSNILILFWEEVRGVKHSRLKELGILLNTSTRCQVQSLMRRRRRQEILSVKMETRPRRRNSSHRSRQQHCFNLKGKPF